MIAWGPFWIACIVSAIVANPVLALLKSLQSRQTISEFAPEAHQKKQGTPTMGGLIVLAGLLVAFLVGAAVSWNTLSGSARMPGTPVPTASPWPALIVLLGFGFIGFVDDFVVPRVWKGKRGLGWKQKLLLQIVCAAGAIATAPALSGSVVGMLGGAFAILYCANAYNFADGLDGLAGGLAVILSLSLATIAGGMRDPAIAGQCQALAGAMLPFLLQNAPPAKVFMGDVGALPVGGLLGLWIAQGIASAAGPDAAFGPSFAQTVAALLVLTLVLHAELIPVPLQVFWVKAFKRRLFPYTPIHHAFERAGWPETRVVAYFLIAQLLLAVLAFTIAYSWRPQWM